MLRSFENGSVEKAAALLFSLDRSISIRLVKDLDQTEMAHLLRTAATLSTLRRSEVEALLADFRAALMEDEDVAITRIDAENFASAALSDEVASKTIMEAFEPSKNDVWKQFEETGVDYIVKCLQNEHPQAIAYAIRQFDRAFAGRVLLSLDSSVRELVIMTMTTVREPTRTVLDALHMSIIGYLDAFVGTPPEASTDAATAILNRLPRDLVEELLQGIMQRSPEIAASLRNGLFSFEDLPALDTEAMRIVFDSVSPESVVLALQGMNEHIVQHVLTALGARARRMVEAELERSALYSSDDIASARLGICETVLDMAAKGHFAIPASS